MKNDIISIQEAYRSIYNEALSVDEAISKLPPEIQEIARNLQEYLSRGARKASFYYRSKLSGREGKYLVNLGVDYGAAKIESYERIKQYKEMVNLITKKYEFDKWYVVPKYKQIDFNIVRINPETNLIELKLKNHITRNQVKYQVNFEQLNLMLYHPELFDTHF